MLPQSNLQLQVKLLMEKKRYFSKKNAISADF